MTFATAMVSCQSGEPGDSGLDRTCGVVGRRERRDPVGALVVAGDGAGRDVGVAGDRGLDEPAQRARDVRVVAVDEGHPVPAGRVEAEVAWRARGAVVHATVHHAYAIVLGGQPVGDGAGVVGRAVVDDEDLDVGPVARGEGRPDGPSGAVRRRCGRCR